MMSVRRKYGLGMELTVRAISVIPEDETDIIIQDSEDSSSTDARSSQPPMNWSGTKPRRSRKKKEVLLITWYSHVVSDRSHSHAVTLAKNRVWVALKLVTQPRCLTPCPVRFQQK